MIIGKIDNKNVIFSHTDKMVRIEHTNIIIIGVESAKNAIEKCKVNFKGFEEV